MSNDQVVTHNKTTIWKIVCLFFLFYINTSTVYSDTLVVEPDMGRTPLYTAITRAHRSIHIVMYGLTDSSLLKKLIEQKQRGVEVKIILEKNPYHAENENKKAMRVLTENGIRWHTMPPSFDYTHQKTLIIDNRIALVMTFNFTRSTFQQARNFGIILDNPRWVHDIESAFEADWQKQVLPPHAWQLLYSPNDSRAKLIQTIANAKENIMLYAQTISDDQIVRALGHAADLGVHIEILTSSHPAPRYARFFKRKKIVIHGSKQHYIHAKVWIIDHRKAIIGSINLTETSLDHNRELAVITDNANIIR